MNGLKNNTSGEEAAWKRRGDCLLSPSLKIQAVHFEMDLVTENVIDVRSIYIQQSILNKQVSVINVNVRVNSTASPRDRACVLNGTVQNVSREMPHVDTHASFTQCVCAAGYEYSYKVHIATITAAKETFKCLLKILVY